MIIICVYLPTNQCNCQATVSPLPYQSWNVDPGKDVQVQFNDAWRQIWKLCEIYFWMKTSSYMGLYLFAIMMSRVTSLAPIMALSCRGMLRTRTSITAPQAYKRASRNLVPVVRGLSIYVMNSPLWSQICSMGFRPWFGAGHCMTSTSSPAREMRVFYEVCGVALSCRRTKFL